MDPVYKRFREQKAQAQVRGVPWELPYWEWLQIWQDSGHLEERGHNGGQWVMGRNGHVGSYSSDNVKIIRVESNNTLAALGRHRRKIPRVQPS